MSVKAKIIFFSVLGVLVTAIVVVGIVFAAYMIDFERENTPETTATQDTASAATPTPTPSLTATPEPTITSTPEPTPTPDPTPEPTPEQTATPEPTATPTPNPTPTPTPRATPGETEERQKVTYIKIDTSRFGNPADKMIAFTFDDGPQVGGNSTEMLLDGLKERNAKATFFIVSRGIDRQSGYYDLRNVNLVLREAAEGHMVANHSYNHDYTDENGNVLAFSKLSAKDAYYQIDHSNDLIEDLTGVRPIFFRAPGGSIKRSIMDTAGMINIYWCNFDAEDWNRPAPIAKFDKDPEIHEQKKEEFIEQLYQKIITKVQDGDIVLLHDLYDTTAIAVLRAMDTLAAQGYRFVTLDELLMRNASENQALSTTYVYKYMRYGETPEGALVDIDPE